METFQINEHYAVVCEWVKTRTAFKHTAVLLRHGMEVDRTKVCYQNRTWESYEYETVLRKLLENNKDSISAEESTGFLKHGEQQSRDKVASTMKMVSGIAALGDLVTTSKKEANDWKARMLKAGLPGLDIPEDWETLSETEKARRLDNVMAFGAKQ